MGPGMGGQQQLQSGVSFTPSQSSQTVTSPLVNSLDPTEGLYNKGIEKRRIQGGDRLLDKIFGTEKQKAEKARKNAAVAAAAKVPGNQIMGPDGRILGTVGAGGQIIGIDGRVVGTVGPGGQVLDVNGSPMVTEGVMSSDGSIVGGPGFSRNGLAGRSRSGFGGRGARGRSMAQNEYNDRAYGDRSMHSMDRYSEQDDEFGENTSKDKYINLKNEVDDMEYEISELKRMGRSKEAFLLELKLEKKKRKMYEAQSNYSQFGDPVNPELVRRGGWWNAKGLDLYDPKSSERGGMFDPGEDSAEKLKDFDSWRNNQKSSENYGRGRIKIDQGNGYTVSSYDSIDFNNGSDEDEFPGFESNPFTSTPLGF